VLRHFEARQIADAAKRYQGVPMLLRHHAGFVHAVDQLEKVDDFGQDGVPALSRQESQALLNRHGCAQTVEPFASGIAIPVISPIIRTYVRLVKHHRAPIDDGGALAMETARFRDIYNRIRPHQSLGDRTLRDAYLGITGGASV